MVLANTSFLQYDNNYGCKKFYRQPPDVNKKWRHSRGRLVSWAKNHITLWEDNRLSKPNKKVNKAV
jgi:hypothetical protein